MIQASTPKLDEEYIEKATEALRTSFGEKRNQFTAKLQNTFYQQYPNRSVALFSHCTNAMHATLSALRRRHPDRNEVIIPALSWVSTASTIIHSGLNIVFVDVDLHSVCIDPNKIEEKITQKTLAVMPVDLAGNMADYSTICDLLRNYPDIYILQDSAEALGAKLNDGTKAGMSGDVSFFSFHATKLINCGQGGAALFKDDKLANEVKKIAHHGIDTAKTGKYYWSDELGMNYSWTDFQAALAWSQLLEVEKLTQHRKEIFFYYSSNLTRTEDFELMEYLDYCEQVFWLPFFSSRKLKNDADRDRFMSLALENNIQLRPMFYPLPAMPPFEFSAASPVTSYYPNAYQISRNSLTLPTGARPNFGNLQIVCEFLIRQFDCGVR